MRSSMRILILVLVAALALSVGGSGLAENKKVDTLKIGFVPSRDAEQIITQTEPLKELLKAELAKLGYDVGSVEISVGTSYEGVGEALSAGSVDIGLIPAGTYVTFSDGCSVLLTATRAGLSKSSENPKDWNDGQPTLPTDQQVNYYLGLIIAGPSEKGKALAAKVNAGEALTWDDLNAVNWAVANPTSSSGYIYPTLWLNKNYGKTVKDLTNVVPGTAYADMMAELAAEQIDVCVGYADLRRDYADKWTTDMGRKDTIWTETNVIGVTPAIFNDTVSISKTSALGLDPDFGKAFATALINIAQTDAGKEVIKIYSHEGYVVANDSDYDGEREVHELMANLG